MLNEKLKNKNGITLIALVVTIVVLLILASVTIQMVFSDNGIIKRAQGAADAQKEAQDKDTLATMMAGYEVERLTSSKSLLDYFTELKTKGDISNVTAYGETGVIVTLNNGAQYKVNEDGTTSEGQEEEDTYTGNLSSDERTALASNGMSELSSTDIDNDSNLTNDQKTALKDTTKVKAVLTGNVPVPVGYDYVEGTTTAITKPEGGSYGVVVEDANENQWVWVPVNATESVAPSAIYSNVDGINVGENKKQDNENKIKLELAKNINGLRIASINDLPSLKVASSSSSSEESGPATSVTTTKKGASNIINGCDRGDPNDTSSYREPALVTKYDERCYGYAGFSSLDDMADKIVADYEAMITSITKYGGFYVGRYELSGTTNVSGSKITNAKVQAGQAPIGGVGWYELYSACITFETSTTTSTMIWGTQWDVVCNWSEKVGDQISYSTSQSNRHTQDYRAKTGSNANDIRNNVYDLEGSFMEWTQEAFDSEFRAVRGGDYRSSWIHPADNRSIGWPESSETNRGTRPTLYIK